MHFQKVIICAVFGSVVNVIGSAVSFDTKNKDLPLMQIVTEKSIVTPERTVCSEGISDDFRKKVLESMRFTVKRDGVWFVEDSNQQKSFLWKFVSLDKS